jgi:hypothetical protein
VSLRQTDGSRTSLLARRRGRAPAAAAVCCVCMWPIGAVPSATATTSTGPARQGSPVPAERAHEPIQELSQRWWSSRALLSGCGWLHAVADGLDPTHWYRVKPSRATAVLRWYTALITPVRGGWAAQVRSAFDHDQIRCAGNHQQPSLPVACRHLPTDVATRRRCSR